LNKFASFAGVPYYKLRDAQKASAEREKKAMKRNELEQSIKQAALQHPTFGYRRLRVVLGSAGIKVGLHRLRTTLERLDLNPKPIRKARRIVPGVVPVSQWPEGRRVQIDATRLSLDDGIVWVYIVLDVLSRAVLAIKAVRSLSQYQAKQTLLEAVNELELQGITQKFVVQSDGGSDFTSEVFQQACAGVGCWVRSRVSQKGGMGILERCNRTFKYDFVFRLDWKTLEDAVKGVQEFRDWYNKGRVHSAVGYVLPWEKLVESGKYLLAA
jgi:putative transposase